MLQALRFRWHRLRRHARMLAADAHGYLRWLALNARPATRGGLGRCAYSTLTEVELRARRRSDTVFVFGSGYSLNDITPAGWRHIVLVGVEVASTRPLLQLVARAARGMPR